MLREISDEEMASCSGPFNYISHHGVPKPGSVTTSLRVIYNSSLNNKNSGLSYNDILPKGPNSLCPLQQSLAHSRTQQHVVVADLAKAYNTVLTYPEEMHMRHLVWRWGKTKDKWLTYGLTKMHFDDRPAACGL